MIAAVREDRTPLLLTERKEHLEQLAQRLAPEIKHIIILRGGMGRKELRAALDELANIPAETPRVILATGKFIGEGFDDSRLDTLFLTLPVSCVAPWHNMRAVSIGSTRASARCAFAIMPT